MRDNEGVFIEISEGDDSRLSDYTNLTDVALRSKAEPEKGLYMAESKNVITRALEAGHRPRSVLMAPKWLPVMKPLFAKFLNSPDGGEIPIFLADEALLRQITGFKLHRGALAAMHRPQLAHPNTILSASKRIAVLENIVDHTNVGAAFRSAAALGMDAVFVTPSCADPLYRRSVRVSMGTVFQIPWTRLEKWPDANLFHEFGFQMAALALSDNSLTLPEYVRYLQENPDQKVALLLGTEGDGLTKAATDAADVVVKIPMAYNVDSLNVAAASAVAFWAINQNRL